ncbi:spore germination protein [Petroclostridium sp. X23]|uniref:spore germination protein n=1 Tax=Petroclostridium sp. X23 TaxID=3045146 RepID=UPI0024AE6A53|nr:spore germination protein [Petroclostridium sp. X23]WHH58586.1 spore germination protein [Petroclostridium sp. X23]
MRFPIPFFREFNNRKNNPQVKSVKKERISFNLTNNINKLKEIFQYPLNQDFVIRPLRVKALGKRGVLVYLDVMVKEEKIEKYIINPLMTAGKKEVIGEDLDDIIHEVFHVAKAEKVGEFNKMVKDIMAGKTILLIDGCFEGVSLNTVGYEHRSVEQTKIENVIKGPKEAFVDSYRVNRSLIRKYVRSEKLVTETIHIGERSDHEIAMMYISDIADPKLVEDVRKRLSEIQIDGLITIAQLEQHIEERPYSLVPTVLLTERPDRTASFLQEGHIVLVDTTPGCLVVPATFWSFFHTAEDQYQRWPYGNFIRLIRMLAFHTALLLPAGYIALSNYHLEMVPTDLLLSIAATRELVPFPVFIEILIMEISFELIREAGARVPTTLGPTISIVGALILGQAAVQAGIISPILIIVVALTGLASFAIPENSTNYMIRMARFAFLLSASFMGFYGIALLAVFCIGYLCSVKSFDVPFLSPLVPRFSSSRDMVFRAPAWKQWQRPRNINPQDPTKKKEPNRRSKP